MIRRDTRDTKTYTVHDQFFSLFDRMLGDVDIPKALQDVASVVQTALNCERVTIYLKNNETDELISTAVIGNVPRMIKIPISDKSLAGYCARNSTPLCIQDAYGDLSHISSSLVFDKKWDEINNFRTKDVICAPVVFKEELVGVVQAINCMSRSFDQSCLPMLKSIARLVAYALNYSKLFDDNARMRYLEGEKAKFMQIMVHELKSPIAASKMMIDVMREYHPLPEKSLSMANRISARLEQLTDMTHDVLSLADVKTGRPLSKIAVFDIVAQTSHYCKDHIELASTKGIEFDISTNEEKILVRFDPKGYQLVLSNLASNAIKYSQRGKVKVELSKDDDWATLSVKDTGIGIPSEDLPKMFRPFYRASNAVKSKIPGSGVGLAGVKDIIERFGGHIEIESEVNVGSTFKVSIPLKCHLC